MTPHSIAMEMFPFVDNNCYNEEIEIIDECQ